MQNARILQGFQRDVFEADAASRPSQMFMSNIIKVQNVHAKHKHCELSQIFRLLLQIHSMEKQNKKKRNVMLEYAVKDLEETVHYRYIYIFLHRLIL